MERPTFLSISDKRFRGRLGSAATVAVIHVAAIFGLVAALNQGALMKEIRIIQASINAPQEVPREPPPAPKEHRYLNNVRSWRARQSSETTPPGIQRTLREKRAGMVNMPLMALTFLLPATTLL